MKDEQYTIHLDLESRKRVTSDGEDKENVRKRDSFFYDTPIGFRGKRKIQRVTLNARIADSDTAVISFEYTLAGFSVHDYNYSDGGILQRALPFRLGRAVLSRGIDEIGINKPVSIAREEITRAPRGYYCMPRILFLGNRYDIRDPIEGAQFITDFFIFAKTKNKLVTIAKYKDDKP